MAGFYSISLDITGNSLEQIKQIQGSLEQLGVKAEQTRERVKESVSQMDERFRELRNTIIEVFAFERIKAFGMEILNTTAEIEGFENRIKFASVNTLDAGRNMYYLQQTIQNMHLPMAQTMQGFSEMQAGLRGTGIEGERLRQLFTGLSAAAATLHMDNYSLQRTMQDFKEIGEIGLNMRIYRSLGTAFPGIGKVIQETFGKSFHELEKEKLPGAEFLAKIGPALEKEYSSGLANWGDSLQAKMNDTNTAFKKMQFNLGESLKPMYIDLMNQLIKAMGALKDFSDWLGRNKDIVHGVMVAVEQLTIAFVSYKVATTAAAIITALVNTRITESGVVIREATEAVEGFSLSWETLGFGAIAIGIGLITEKLISMTDAFEDNLEKVYHWKEFMDSLDQEDKENDDIQKRMKYLSDLNPEGKQQLLQDLKSSRDNLQLSYDENSDKMAEMNKKLVHISPKIQQFMPAAGTGGMGTTVTVDNPDFVNLRQKIGILDATVRTEAFKMGDYKTDIDRLKAMGIKDIADPSAGAAGDIHNLGGEHGGLGQAKIINIHVDTMQKNEVKDGRDLVDKGKDAINEMFRIFFNVAGNQSTVM